MSEIKVTRRLVKSPPELWAEVSDAQALARWLGAFGEIRVTRTEPETTVAWEGEHARGTVAIEGSGWGTAVTITAQPSAPPTPVAERPAPGPPAPPTPDPAPPSPAPPPAPPVPPSPPAPDPVPPSPTPDPGPPGPPEPGPQMREAPAQAASVDSGPRRGFFARLFGRDAPSEAVPAPPEPTPVSAPPAATPVSAPPAATPVSAPPVPRAVPPPPPPAAAAPEPEPEPEPGPEPVDVRGVLERALDDLGAAHHRPFSRG
jgi:hypothetical protein